MEKTNSFKCKPPECILLSETESYIINNLLTELARAVQWNIGPRSFSYGPGAARSVLSRPQSNIPPYGPRAWLVRGYYLPQHEILIQVSPVFSEAQQSSNSSSKVVTSVILTLVTVYLCLACPISISRNNSQNVVGNIIQLSPKGEVNSGGYIPRRSEDRDRSVEVYIHCSSPTLRG